MIPAYEEMYGAQKRISEEELRAELEKIRTSYAARGRTGRALQDAEAEAVRELLERMGLFRGKLGMMGEQTEEARRVATTGFERGRTMTYAQWAQQEKEAEKQRTWQTAESRKQRDWQEKVSGEERKRQRKQFITRALISTAMGAGIGALAPGAMGVAAGAKGAGWAGAGRGALMGGHASGQMLAMYPWMQSLTQQPTQSTQPAISGRQYPEGSFESWLEIMFPYYKGVGR